VLYVTDLESETPAAAYATSLASDFQAHLSLLHATEDQSGPSPEVLAERACASVPFDAGLPRRPTAFVKYGSPVERILEAEHERGANLIVLAARRADQFSDAPAYLAWSGIERIVTQAHCPVLTVCS
jgi:nucleotide-binding universal stress UspA family protein